MNEALGNLNTVSVVVVIFLLVTVSADSIINKRFTTVSIMSLLVVFLLLAIMILRNII